MVSPEREVSERLEARLERETGNERDGDTTRTEGGSKPRSPLKKQEAANRPG